MLNRYNKPEKIFAAGLPVVWLILNFIFFRFNLDSVGYQIISALLILIELMFITVPSLYRSVFRGWTFIAKKIGQFNSYLILTLIFYLVFSPVGLLLRILRKDLLDQKINKGQASYWKNRSQSPPDLEQYKRIF